MLASGVVAGLGLGCTGPGLHIHNPSGHACFVDGHSETGPDLPFRYYGASRVDALPADVNGRPDWDLTPASQVVEHGAPASPWLFPLDFPIELVHRAWSGRQDRTVVIELPATPPEQRVLPEVKPTGLDAVGERALQARIAR